MHDADRLNDESWSPEVTVDATAVSDGWREHRRVVRRRGPVLALAVPAAAGVTAVLCLWGSTQWWRGAAGLALAVAAAPLLPVAGVPAIGDAGRVAAGVAASAVVWIALGWLAARRATRLPGASWPEWRRHYLRLALGFVMGGWSALALGGLLVLWRAR